MPAIRQKSRPLLAHVVPGSIQCGGGFHDTIIKPELLNGVAVVKGSAVSLAYNESGVLDRKEQSFMAIPYYAWANRGPGEMAVLHKSAASPELGGRGRPS